MVIAARLKGMYRHITHVALHIFTGCIRSNYEYILAIEITLSQEVEIKFMEEAGDNQVAGDCFLDRDFYFCDVYCPPSLDVLHLLASVL